MNKLLTIVLAIALVGCQTTPTPAIIYKTQEVKIAVPVFVDAPVVEPFESKVLSLTDTSSDGEVGKSYKSDWLTLMYRDRIFTDFLSQYRKAKTDAQATGK